jgi:hypothetical protein
MTWDERSRRAIKDYPNDLLFRILDDLRAWDDPDEDNWVRGWVYSRKRAITTELESRGISMRYKKPEPQKELDL